MASVELQLWVALAAVGVAVIVAIVQIFSAPAAERRLRGAITTVEKAVQGLDGIFQTEHADRWSDRLIASPGTRATSSALHALASIAPERGERLALARSRAFPYAR